MTESPRTTPASSRFTGRRAIVTGSGSGIGRAVASRLAGEGAEVVLADIDVEAVHLVVEELRSRGDRAHACVTDVSEESSVVDMVKYAISSMGGLDLLHNNAAALGSGTHGMDGLVHELDIATWERTFAVNARGVMLGCKHGIREMLASGGGVIVNTVSTSAFIGDTVSSAYASSKAAVVAFTRTVATMYGRQGIRCNAVAPGLVLTPAAARNLSDRDRALIQAERLCTQPTLPDDVAALVAFLFSDEAGSLTGQTIVLDGGTLAHRPSYSIRFATPEAFDGESTRYLSNS